MVDMKNHNMLDVNIFTNCTKNHSSNADMLINTWQSFIQRFGVRHINSLRIFIDPRPKQKNIESYVNDIEANLKYNHEIHITNGLADGYIKSTQVSQTDFIFQLEHDWEFLSTIKHDLDFIVNCMKKEGMQHLRFNKRANINMPFETLTEIHSLGFKFCKTQGRSNNPHIIDRKSYLDTWNNNINLSNHPKRSDGIENNLTDTLGYIYGGYQYPQQIHHTDGTGQMGFFRKLIQKIKRA